MLTPSSNTTLEPYCSQMVSGLPCTMHFSRFPVRSISLSVSDLAQFDFEPMLAAARLLADAHCDVIAWNGTSGGWLGLQTDRALCAAIERETGIPALTTTEATLQACRVYGVRQMGLAVPYEGNVIQAITRTFQQEGVEVSSARGLNLRVNTAFAEVPQETIRTLIAEVATKAEAVNIFCTNFPGAPLVEEMERVTGKLILDSVTVTVWATLQRTGITTGVSGWGRLLRENPSHNGWA